MRSPICCIALLCGLIAPNAFAQEWTRFRGPNGTGISDAATIPTKWTDADYVWKIELPGEGHSSPVLWGKKLFLLCTDKKTATRTLVCIDADTGKVNWKTDFASSTSHLHDFNSYASSTPAVDAERVYITWATPEKDQIVALDHDGKIVWDCDLGPFNSQHGSGASPMVYEDKVIIADDQLGPSFVFAIDAKSGKVVWRTARRSANTAYSTPCVYTPATGRPMLLFTSNGNGISAMDPDSGAMLWDTPKVFDKRSIFSPVLAGDVVIGSCGSGGGAKNYTVALKLDPHHPNDPPKELYRIDRASAYVPTPISFNGRIFMVADSGVATCFNPETGEVVWRERLGGEFFSSPLCINGVIYAVSRAGEVVTFKASDQFEVLGRMPLDELTHATPAVAMGRLYIRTLTHLYCIGGKS
ncbi:MAG: PQQ-binding-like beta-propeller repeat protein [Planctomycetes bacterium]|nr:PQQ-binding-like beta-propeller repeat protein [Planctomycetota bacterium]